MAFHEIKIGSNNFTLAPQQVKPYTSSTNNIYPISFLSDLGTTDGLTARTVYTDTTNQLHYNPSTSTLTAGKLLCLHDGEADAGKGSGILMTRGGVNDGVYDWQMWIDSGALKFSYNNTSWYDVFSSNGKNLTMHSGSIITPGNDNEGILPATNNYGQIGSETKKFYRMYASTFNGDLKGSATNATYINVTTATANTSYYVQFVNGTTGYRRSYTDTNLLYNPSTNTLTIPKIKYTSSAQQWIGGKTLTNNAFYPSNNFTTTAFFPILAAKTSGENVITLGGLGDQYGFYGYKKDTTENKTDWHFKWDSNNGNTYVTGKIYGTATHADNINVSAATASATYYVSFVNGTSGARIPYVDSGLYYNPSTNVLTITGHINATNGFYETSDERLKDFQEDIEVNFSYLHNIPKKYYSWKDDATYTRHIGTSAQEVQKHYPELVNTDENGYLTMNYDKLSVVSLKAIDVLHEEITELKKENAELKERLARLEELILNR